MARAAYVQTLMLQILASSGLHQSKSSGPLASDICDELKYRTFGFDDRYCQRARTFHTLTDMIEVFNSEQKYWDSQGEQAPWWAMLTNYPKGVDIPEEDKERFYQSGSDDVNATINLMGQVHANPKKGAALDFGCGMGRVAQGLLSAGFRRVVCVDHSPAILTAAQAKLTEFAGKGPVLKGAAHRIEYVQSGPDLLCKVKRGTFDFVYSVLTLQTMKAQLQVAYIEQMCDALLPGGSGFLQTATSLRKYDDDQDHKFEADHCSLQAEEASEKNLHYTPKFEIMKHLLKRGCTVLNAYSCPKIGDAGESTCFAFQKKKA